MMTARSGLIASGILPRHGGVVYRGRSNTLTPTGRLAVPCPRCGAQPGRSCTSMKGGGGEGSYPKRVKFHDERRCYRRK